MRWYTKSLIFKAVSLVPGGVSLYNFAQHKITKSTHPTESRVRQKLEVGHLYWNWLKKNSRTSAVVNGAVGDLGAGWHPTIPMLFYRLGARRQVLLDVLPIMKNEFALDTARLCRSAMESETDPARKISADARPLPDCPSMEELFRRLGIEYVAPYPGRFDGPPGTLDSVFSTQVLQHIPEEIMADVFKEIFRWLKPGGLFLATVHLTFQFGTPDTNRRQYQHLSVSPRAWRTFFSSRIMSFNRYKAPDYRRALEAAGFRIVEMDVTQPTAQDMEYFDQTNVHTCFSHLRREDLAARLIFFVAEKPLS